MAFNTETKLQFLNGTQASIDALISAKTGINPGAFYLTHDTHRLYVGMSNESIVPVSETIVQVDAIDNLSSLTPTLGTFYYAKAENVLCIYTRDSGGNISWVQINPQTTIQHSNLTATKNDLTGGGNRINVTSYVKDSDGATYNAYWGFKSDKTITLSLSNENTSESDSESTANPKAKKKRQIFEFKVNTVIGTEESNTSGIIALTNSGDDSKKITIEGSNSITVSSTDDGKITVSGADLDDEDIKSISQTINSSGVFTTTLTKNDNSTTLTNTFTPTIKYGSDYGSSAVFKGNGTTGAGVAQLDVYTTSQVDDLLEKNLAELNAMTYKGTTPNVPNVGDGSDSKGPKDLFTPNSVKIGDTYKVAQAKKYTQDGYYYANEANKPNDKAWASVGDLLIANVNNNATETNGVISYKDLRWDYVQSGDDVNNIYEVVSGDSKLGFTIKEKNSSGNILDFDLATEDADSDIVISRGAVANTSYPDLTLTIKHKAYGEATTTAPTTGTTNDQAEATSTNGYDTTTDLTYVSGLVLNNGHVTGITQSKMTLVDTNARMQSVSVTPDVTDGVATLTTTVALDHAGDNAEDKQAGNVKLTSLNSNLQMSKTTLGSGTSASAALAFNLVWGTF